MAIDPKSIPDTIRGGPGPEGTAELRRRGDDMDMMANIVGADVRELSTFNYAGTCNPVPNGRRRAQARGPP